MRAIQGRSRKETLLKSIGEGLIFLVIGGVIMVLNVPNVGGQSITVALQRLPIWVWVIGGGTGLFGLYWILKNVWLFVSSLKASERIDMQ